MEAVNSLRIVLVAGAVAAALGAVVFGEWVAAGVLLVGIAIHGWLWWHLHQQKQTAPPE